MTQRRSAAWYSCPCGWYLPARHSITVTPPQMSSPTKRENVSDATMLPAVVGRARARPQVSGWWVVTVLSPPPAPTFLSGGGGGVYWLTRAAGRRRRRQGQSCGSDTWEGLGLASWMRRPEALTSQCVLTSTNVCSCDLLFTFFHYSYVENQIHKFHKNNIHMLKLPRHIFGNFYCQATS